MSQDDGKGDFLSLDPPLTLSPPSTLAPSNQPSKQDQPPAAVVELAAKPTPVAPAPVAPTPAPVATTPDAQPTAAQQPASDFDEDDDVIIVEEDDEPAQAPVQPQPTAQAQAPVQPQAPVQAAPAPSPTQQPPATPQLAASPAPQAEPEPAPAEPAFPPSLDELAAATDHHADLNEAFSQVASSSSSAPSATSVLRQTRKTVDDSGLKKNAIPVLFTIGSICFAIGGWALMAKLGIIKFEGVDAEAIKNHDLKVMIGLASIPVGILLILSSIYMGVQVYGKKPEAKPRR